LTCSMWRWDEERPYRWMWWRENDRANASGRIRGLRSVRARWREHKGQEEIVVGMTRGYDMAARDRYVMRLRGFGDSGIRDS
jgi:hypothetical protein